MDFYFIQGGGDFVLASLPSAEHIKCREGDECGF